MTILTLTSKGQVTLKKEFLAHLDIKPGDKINVVTLPDGKLEISAARMPAAAGGLDAFFGSLKNKHRVHASLDEIQHAIEEGWAGKVLLDDQDDL